MGTLASRKKKRKKLTAAEESAKRSAAAKKGWQTRWKKQALRAARAERERALNVLRGLSEEDREEVLVEFGGVPKILRERLANIANLESVRKSSVALLRHYEEKAQAEREKILKKVEKITGSSWVNAVSPEYIRRNGSMAVVANHARYILDSESYWNAHVIMRQTVSEYGYESSEAKDMAISLSQQYDISSREIWSILMSP